MYGGPEDLKEYLVHPHACGEHVERPSLKIVEGGSSPRLWGTYNSTKNIYVQIRFIPTPVGNMLPGTC